MPHPTDSRILIVDDQSVNLSVLTMVLDNAGYHKIRCVNDSREVLPAFAEFAPDLVVLDLHMPHLDGLAVMDQLAQVIDKNDYLPILVLTGDVTHKARETVLSRGAKDFISKPLNSTDVQLRVRNLLQTRSLHLQLKTQNESLEQQVRMRTLLTEELTQSNQALEETNRRLKETQAQLIQTEKMASLGQLVAGIAHEINNPLAFTVNHLFTIERDMDYVTTDGESQLSSVSQTKVGKIRRRLDEIKEGLDRVKALVLNLRTFSRLDEGILKTVDLAESIDSVLMLLRYRMNGRIHIERLYERGRMLHCYAGRLNQVILNLVSNGMDAIEGKGTVTISTSYSDTEVCISVRDTGSGIPEAIRGRIFDPFFTTKPVGTGTGLGLAISYGIIQDHQGSIEVNSELGVGSEFKIRIPTNLESRKSYDEKQTAGIGRRNTDSQFH